jgi:demethylmenaquinone methyltransferase/2-methoxy-6-polyprenyl-1,4-benzoquinol methylase
MIVACSQASHDTDLRTTMTETEIYIQRLLESNPLREPLLREIIRALNLPSGSHGLDAGCGIGLQALLLIEAIGNDGHVTGLDILPELLDYGQKLVTECGQAENITFRQGSVDHLPFDNNAFDWVWSMDCIGYPAAEIEPILEELKRVVKPGGDIRLFGWSSQQVLPGYPLLEARLNATCSAYLPFLKDKQPASNFMCAAQALRNAGMKDVQAQTFVGDVQSPLTQGQRVALASLFEMLWGTPQPEVAQEDFREYQRLCESTSPDFILDVPDYYAFFTYSMFRGKVGKS